MRKVALYCRVSTHDQDTQNQLRALHEHATRAGWVIVREYTDTRTGYHSHPLGTPCDSSCDGSVDPRAGRAENAAMPPKWRSARIRLRMERGGPHDRRVLAV
jgi:hypothetical protein